MKPVFPSAEVALSNGSFRAPQDASILLSNPLSAPMWIDKINIFATPGGSALAGSVARAELRIGNTYLTNGPVPSLLLFEPDQFKRNVVNLNEDSLWELSRPIFIPEGEFLLPRFCHAGDGTTSNITVRITYSGRSFEAGDPEPSEYWLPFVSSFIGTARVGGADYTETSSESALRNPFSEPLDVVCLNGSLKHNIGSTFDGPVEFQTILRAVNQDSIIVIKDGTDFFSAFGNQDSFRTRFTLPPNGFVVLQLTENYAALDVSNVIRPRFSMVGYRKVVRR